MNKIFRSLVVGNWKMNGLLAESEALLCQLHLHLDGPREVDICICPPFTALALVGKLIASSHISLGAQDVHHLESGAYTGEISLPMLKEVGCRYVLVGHSERRQYFGETDAQVAAKVAAILRHGLVPILCVGEDLTTRDTGAGEAQVLLQVRNALALLQGEARELVIAYEPIWAIGTGQAAGPEQANAMLGAIYAEARTMLLTAQIRLLYGGSVTPQNAAGFFAMHYVGGVLAGGVSLKAESFAQLVHLAGGKLHV